MENFDIRPATLADGNLVYGFVCDLEKKQLQRDLFLPKFASLLSNSRHYYLVAIIGEDVVGFLSGHCQDLLHHDYPICEIQELYVQERWRGQRVGEALILNLEQQLNKSNLELIEVSSRHQRQDAHRFYLRCGFANTHLKLTKKLGQG